MIAIGRHNELRVVKTVDFGLYLDGGEYYGEILMPRRYVTEGTKEDDMVKVFVYFDSEDRVIATTEEPIGMADEFALLRVVANTKVGTFFDWGIMKDLLVPYAEQHRPVESDEYHMVRIFIDPDSGRLVGSTKLHRFLDRIPADFEIGEEVSVKVFDQTDIGYRVIVHNAFLGMIYKNEVYEDLYTGQEAKAYVTAQREDNKIDLSFYPPGYGKIEGMAKELYTYIQEQDGQIYLTDKSPAEDIYETLRMSKKNFKKAVGTLYKQRHIILSKTGIRISPNKKK